MLKTSAPFAAGLVIALACAVPAIAAPKAKPKATRACAERGHTVAASSRARVFYVRGFDRADNDPHKFPRRDYFGCVYGKKPQKLAASYRENPSGASAGVMGLRLQGSLVTFDGWGCSTGTNCSHRIRTIDLRGGSVTRQADVGVAFGEGLTLAVAPDGSFAAGYRMNSPFQPVRRIVAAGPGGSATLDSGPDVDPESVAIGGGVVYWTRAGEVQHAALP